MGMMWLRPDSCNNSRYNRIMSETSVGTRARFSLQRVTASDRSFGDEVRAGLTAVQKSIPPRYFYDDIGSALFEAICFLPEYYVTRAETELLRRAARMHFCATSAPFSSPATPSSSVSISRNRARCSTPRTTTLSA